MNSTEQPYDDEHLSSTAALFHAIGDTKRLRLLCLLSEQELCVTDIANITYDDLPTISQRLRVLFNAGFVERRRAGKQVFYSLSQHQLLPVLFKQLQSRN